LSPSGARAPAVGGSFTFTDRREGEDVEHVGEYLELTRPRRIVFALRVPKYAQQSDRVAVDIVPLAAGCEVTITHEFGPLMAATPENAANVKKAADGWTGVLRGLARAWRIAQRTVDREGAANREVDADRGQHHALREPCAPPLATL
jgi:uncharacterized protein YndB with AHSA1/START domain